MDPSLPRSASDPLSPLTTALADRYRVEREIGAGGMATVYLARDLRHNRQVAVKVLRPELGAVLGAERFLAEIQVTANLQHPNLLPLFDSGEASGLLYYVMPYVEGESLRARLMREKQLPVDEAVRIAAAVGSALDYAHSHGVIHRDLKPDNILMHAGQPVLADFGIALAVANAGGTRITQTGLSLGTPQYMSPEQATGDRVIDGRTDIYSLGAVLYEMLTGDPPHTGSTAQAVIARVLTDKPRSVRSTRETVPPHVEAAVDRALAKLPADRFATAREFVAALHAANSMSFTGGSLPAQRSSDFSFAFSIPKEKLARATRWTALAALVAVAAWGWLRPAASPARLTRFQVTMSDSIRMRPELAGQNFAISPDGSQLVFPGGLGAEMLYSHRLDELEAKPLRGTERGRQAKFSPDGRWLAFVEGGRLKKIPMPGGPAVTIADTAGTFSWGDRNVIVFSLRGDLYQVSADGGTPSLIVKRDTAAGETGLNWPFMLPGGATALFDIVKQSDQSAGELAAVSLSDGRVTRLGVIGRNPRYVKPGFILFGRLDGTIVAAPFDAKRLRVTGPAVTLLEGVYVKSGGASEFAVGDDGTLFYVEGVADGELSLVGMDGLVKPIISGSRSYSQPRFSPTSGRIVFAMSERTSFSRSDIWVYNDRTRTASRLTNDGKSNQPEWMADGERVVWINTDSGRVVRRQRWDGTGRPETFFVKERPVYVTPSPVGNAFAFSNGSDILVADGDPPGTPRALVATPATDGGPRISPDGKWVAYYSDESGRREVYVTSIAGGGGRHQISDEGGAEPMWSRDGRTIYYRTGGKIFAASITTQPAFVVANRRPLLTDFFRQTGNVSMYDVAPDGRSFLVLTRGDGRERIVVVTGWRQELLERMGVARSR